MSIDIWEKIIMPLFGIIFFTLATAFIFYLFLEFIKWITLSIC